MNLSSANRLTDDSDRLVQPPHMRQRVATEFASRRSIRSRRVPGDETPPFDKKEVRQVCHAINRDQIIATLLEDAAGWLDPLG
jgi:hypothetical protein